MASELIGPYIGHLSCMDMCEVARRNFCCFPWTRRRAPAAGMGMRKRKLDAAQQLDAAPCGCRSANSRAKEARES